MLTDLKLRLNARQKFINFTNENMKMQRQVQCKFYFNYLTFC